MKQTHHKNIAHMITTFQTECLLSFGQLGRLFGVSARQVAGWKRGAYITCQQQKNMYRLYAVLMGLAAPSPVARYHMVFNTTHGKSVFQTFCERNTPHQQLQYSPSVVGILC